MTEHLAQPAAAPSDAARLQRFAASGVNNGNREPLFDQLVNDAARLAGVPLIDEDGYFLGALTILDRAPRALTREQGDILRNIAARVVAELRVRRQADDVARFAAAAADAEERFRDFFERTPDLIMSI